MAITSIKKPAAKAARATKPAVKKPPVKKAPVGGARPGVKKAPVGGGVRKAAPSASAAGAKRTPAKRKPPVKFLFKAPEGLKSCFVMLGFSTAKDGFITPGATAELIRGKWDNENAPTYDLFEHDPTTATTLMSRFMMLTYAPNPIRRLAPNTSYEVLMRLGVGTKDGVMRVGVKIVWRGLTKSGDLQEIVDKKDPELRKLRRAGKFLPGSFTHCVSLDDLREIEREQLREQRELEKEEARSAKLAEREALKEEKASQRTARASKAAPAAKAKARRG